MAKKKEKDKLFDLAEEEDVEDKDIVCFNDYDEERPLGEGVVSMWSIRENYQ